MKKVLTFLAAIGFLSTSSLSVVACGVGAGSTVDTIKDAPPQAKDGQDPVTDYVYNDSYRYDNYATSVAMGTGGQLAIDKIKDHKQENADSTEWQKFYASSSWTDGSFSSIGLDTTSKPVGEHDFSYKANNDQDLFFPEFKENDASKDTNKYRVYWFITSQDAWSQGSSTFKPTKETIVVPNLNEFNDTTKQIKRTGFLHLYLLIPGFRIDFSAEITVFFQKTTDKNGMSVVTLDPDTWKIPYGSAINPEDPSPVYTDRIANVVVVDN